MERESSFETAYFTRLLILVTAGLKGHSKLPSVIFEREQICLVI